MKRFIPWPFPGRRSEVSPRRGYQLWAEHYESENNLMHLLDNQLIDRWLPELPLKDQVILDFGCGTGRYWKELYSFRPKQLIGCDLSEAMLRQLKMKYPEAKVYLLKDHKMPFLADQCIDFLLSTLTIGHLKDLATHFEEWDRKLKCGAYLLLTGNHPEALKMGIKRSFRRRNRSFAIKNYIHDFAEIRQAARNNGWEIIDFSEGKVLEEHRIFFEEASAMNSFCSIKGKPVVYGMLIRKTPE